MIILTIVIIILMIIKIMSPPIKIDRMPANVINILGAFILAITAIIYIWKIRKFISERIIRCYENDKIPKAIAKAFREKKTNDFKDVIKLIRELFDPILNHCFQKVYEDAGEVFEKEVKEDFLPKINNLATQLLNLIKSNDLIDLRDRLQYIIKEEIEKSVKQFNEKLVGTEEYDTVKMENLIISYDTFIGKLNAFYTKEGWVHPPFCLLRCLLSNRRII